MTDKMAIDTQVECQRPDEPAEAGSRSLQSDRQAGQVITVAVVATFTVDPLLEPLTFWMNTLEIAAHVNLAPYSQVMQQLLDSDSLLGRNKTGLNVLLVRIDDWIRDRPAALVEQNLAHARRSALELISAIRAFNSRSPAPLLFFLAPPSSKMAPEYSRPLDELQQLLRDQLNLLANTHHWTHLDLVAAYAVTEHEDFCSDEIAHIPYTNEYFVALATLFSRRIAVLTKPQYKVIAVDCDNTLWRGVCGEDGPEGIELTPEHLELQRLLVRQHDAGVLLCLCTKNNPDDVEQVFNTRAEMPLKLEHIIASRVNWSTKSSNLRSLSGELKLSLDAFIFIDDSLLECAEVRQGCPSALTLPFPRLADEIRHFLAHTWAFDRVSVTKEAQQRTTQYRQNRQRALAIKAAPSLEEFLATLNLKVSISSMESADLTRVAELTQRTNQFNFTTIRRRASEVQELVNAGCMQCLVVHVRDRFGDYGLVGVLLLLRSPDAIHVDTFLLSCRVLGRGVEHLVVQEIGRMSTEEGRTHIVFRYRKTPKNTPAWEFLSNSIAPVANAVSASESGSEHVFSIAAAAAVHLTPGRELPEVTDVNEGANVGEPATTPNVSTAWHETAYRLSRMNDLMREIAKPSTERAPAVDLAQGPGPSPRESVVKIFANVLGIPLCRAEDDFFDLGGDSLKAVRVISRISSILGLQLSLHEFLEAPTARDIAAKLHGLVPAEGALQRIDRSNPMPLSAAQQRLWFLDQLEGDGTAYHIPVLIRVKGALQRDVLQNALDALLDRHEALRTTFVAAGTESIQCIAQNAQFSLQVTDISGWNKDNQDAEVLRQLREEFSIPFDLRVGPLIRGRLLRLANDNHVLLMTMSHMVSDGWSISVLVRDLGVLYEAAHSGKPAELKALPIQYADYAYWQHQWLAKGNADEQLKFWSDHLQGAPALLELPTDRPRPSVSSFRGASEAVAIDASLVAELRELSRRFNVTLAMTLQAAWVILLARLSGQRDIVMGVPVANRPRVELEDLIGLFVETLAVRIQLNGRPRVEELLRQLKQIMVDAYDHQDVPFDKVVEALQPVRTLSHSPIFQAMFVYHNAPPASVRSAGLLLEEHAAPVRASKFDLTLELQESTAGIPGLLKYSTDLFDAATVRCWVECFDALLRGMARQSELEVDRLPIMPEYRRQKIARNFNSTQRISAESCEKTIQQLFEMQVQCTPHHVALVCGDRLLTFTELNARANQLARQLCALGVHIDDRVAVCAERSVELVVAVIGILKAGAAYVPMDPSYPSDRLNFILRDAAPKVLLVEGRLEDRLAKSSAHVLTLDRDDAQLERHSTQDLEVESSARSLAYVIYTSGSTGQPKGVMVEHRNVVSLWRGLECIYRQSPPCERIAVNASFNFDASVKQIIQLLSGRTLVLIPQSVRLDPHALLAFVQEYRVDCVDCTPSQLRTWITAGLLTQGPCSLRVVLIGGEPIDPDLWTTLSAAQGVEFYNVYGPTESTVDATFARLNGDMRSTHIGSPMGARQIYVVDPDGQLAPIGAIGEIFIGGAGVARGYLKRPALTSEKFVADGFGEEALGRLYRTGDLGRWRFDGIVEYIGRGDQQVKIRGIRIELGEIAAQLTCHELVEDAVVVAREGIFGEKRLIAYIVPVVHRADMAGFSEQLRGHLATLLPEYMVPSAFVTLDKLPLSASGKLDLRALPPAPPLALHSRAEYEPPIGPVEQMLAGIWQELVGIRRVGRSNNFFDIGGHSLLVLTALFKINERFGSTLRAIDFYRNPTIQELAMRLGGRTMGDNLVDLSREAALPADIVLKPASCRVPPRTLLLTGATGFVGRFLLVQLLRDTDATIYCLVRATSDREAVTRLRAQLARWNLLLAGEYERRVIAIPGDLRLPRLGMPDSVYDLVCRKVDSIYHCATSMNHLETYSMAKPANVDSASELVRVAAAHTPKLINHISTLSIFTPPATSSERVICEQTSIDSETHRHSNGYVASKWVAEKILILAAERGLACNIFRLGLIWADAKQGRYDELQRVDRMLKSCLISGYGIKSYRYNMPPTPVDYAARAIVSLAKHHADGGGVFHISSAKQMKAGVFERCNEALGLSLELLPYYEWVQEMKRLHHEGRSLPVVPLIEYAFSMDECSFYELQRANRAECLKFDLSRTHAELERYGIVAPALNDELLRVCIEGMIERDLEVRQALQVGTGLGPVGELTG